MTFAAEPATMEARQLLPAPLVWSITAICILPFLLSLVGITFESPDVASLQVAAGSSVPFSVDQSHHALAGSFTHTILEWSAFCAAIFTVVLALAHFRVSKDVTTPVTTRGKPKRQPPCTEHHDPRNQAKPRGDLGPGLERRSQEAPS